MQKIIGKAGNDKSGSVALRLDRKFLQKVKKPPMVIAITGTNGKTTTCNILVDLLESQGIKVASNRGGANLNAGLAMTLFRSVNIFNKPKVDYLVVEYDEISSEEFLPALKPNYLIVMNLTRDSMKRNAHTDYVFNEINKGISPEITLILNADDPISSRLGDKNKKIYFSIDRLSVDQDVNTSNTQDITICPKCHHRLIFDYVRYHHIGKCRCPNCDFKTFQGDYVVTKIDEEQMIVKHKGRKTGYGLITDSIFNIYNQLICITMLSELGFSNEQIKESLKKIKIADIRLKRAKINDIEIIMHMTKGQNSIATSRVFDYVSKIPSEKEIIIINEDCYDKLTSSETMAWIYDADFEYLNKPDIKRIIVGGVRYQDYVLRLLIAGIPKEKIFACEKEADTYKYLSLKNTEQVYILYEIFRYEEVLKMVGKIESKLKEDTK